MLGNIIVTKPIMSVGFMSVGYQVLGTLFLQLLFMLFIYRQWLFSIFIYLGLNQIASGQSISPQVYPFVTNRFRDLGPQPPSILFLPYRSVILFYRVFTAPSVCISFPYSSRVRKSEREKGERGFHTENARLAWLSSLSLNLQRCSSVTDISQVNDNRLNHLEYRKVAYSSLLLGDLKYLIFRRLTFIYFCYYLHLNYFQQLKLRPIAQLSCN